MICASALRSNQSGFASANDAGILKLLLLDEPPTLGGEPYGDGPNCGTGPLLPPPINDDDGEDGAPPYIDPPPPYDDE